MSGLNQVIDAEDIVIEEAVTNASAVYEGLERTRPGTLTGPGGPGLGWALGGALGVKLARPDRRVITVTGDGSFLFGVPTSALMMAAEWGTPFLAVILNNKGYRASRLPVYGLFPDGASAQAQDRGRHPVQLGAGLPGARRRLPRARRAGGEGGGPGARAAPGASPRSTPAGPPSWSASPSRTEVCRGPGIAGDQVT